MRKSPLLAALLVTLSVLVPIPANAATAYPGEIAQVKVKAAGPNRIQVEFKAQGTAKQVAILAGADSMQASHFFHSKWYPAGTRKITLDIPKSQQPYLGSNTGNPIFVRVAVSNQPGASFSRTRSIAHGYRLSLAGSYGYPTFPAVSGSAMLRVAELNVNSVASSAHNYPWEQRVNKIAASIRRTGADVLTTAELTTNYAMGDRGPRQWEDLASRLESPESGGYRLADPVPAGFSPSAERATLGTHILYRPTRLRLLDQAFVNPVKDLGVRWTAKTPVRYLSWAYFEDLTTQRRFYVVAVHLPADDSAATKPTLDRLRTEELAALDRHMHDTVGEAPMILAGDFNSAAATSPQGPQAYLAGHGYQDTAATKQRFGQQYNSANISNQIDNLGVRGYPRTPYRYKYLGQRIDYIFTKNLNGSFRYENVLVLKDGLFDSAYQGSDHNLQLADIGL